MNQEEVGDLNQVHKHVFAFELREVMPIRLGLAHDSLTFAATRFLMVVFRA